MRNYILILINISILFSSCQTAESDAHDHPTSTANSHDDHEETAQQDEVKLTIVQMKKIGIQLDTILMKNLKSTLKVNGRLELPPQNRASVSAMAEGIVEQIMVRPGQYVRKGTMLVSLKHPSYIDLQQQYLETQATLTYLDKELVRQTDLASKEIAPQKQLEKVQSEQAIAMARQKALRSKLNLLGLPIPESPATELKSRVGVYSPIDGYIKQIETNTGAYVAPHDKLFEIVDNHHIHIDLIIFEKDIPQIKEGQIINFILQSNPEKVMNARIFSIGKALEEDQRAVKVHAELDNKDGYLLPGMYVEARIILEDMPQPALSEEAITVDKGLYYIFVVEAFHEESISFKKVQVLKGPTDLGFVGITPLEPLAKDAKVVTKSAYFLMAQTKKEEQPPGHSH